MSAYVKRLADYDIERLTEAVDAMFTASALYGRDKTAYDRYSEAESRHALCAGRGHYHAPECDGCGRDLPAAAERGRAGGGKRRRAVQYVYDERHVPRVRLYGSGGRNTAFRYIQRVRARQVQLPEGKRCNTLTVIELFARPRETLVIDIAKLKTHGMMGYSGAVKNLFGVVPGLLKPELHSRYPEKEPFAEMLVDLCEYVHPDFSIIDAIDAMEGDGPTGGQKRFVGALVGSESPYEADMVGAKLIDMKPEEILVLKNAQERGLCAGKLSEIEVLGDDFENIVVHDFKRARSSSIDFTTRVPKFMQPLAKRILTPYPKINTAQCVGCGKCAESCPQHTITLREHKAHIEYSKCIHCFCCHEMCPKHVINIKRFSLFDL